MTRSGSDGDGGGDDETRREGERESRRRDRPSRYDFSTVRMTFRSGGERCVGRLYRPDRPADPALVVLSGGLLGASGFGLDRYAERLAAAGYAAFRFDPRYAGDSDGDPRNLIAPRREREDWEAALAGLRGRGDVATDRTVLWGVGLAGETVLDVAADDSRIHAVVAQSPVRSGREFLRARGLSFFLRGALAGVRDLAQSPLFGTHSIRVAGDGPTGEDGLALVSAPGAYRRYRELVPDDWENRTPARSLLALARHAPEPDRRRPSCPVLFVGGTRDDVVPIGTVEDAAEAVAESTLVSLPVDHFGFYSGEGLERAVGHGLAFLDAVTE